MLIMARYDVDDETRRLFDVERALADETALAEWFQFDAVVCQYILDPDGVLGGFGVRGAHAASPGRKTTTAQGNGHRPGPSLKYSRPRRKRISDAFIT